MYLDEKINKYDLATHMCTDNDFATGELHLS